MNPGFRCECPRDKCIRTSTVEEADAWSSVDDKRDVWKGEHIAFKDCEWLKSASSKISILSEEGMFAVFRYVLLT
jgi:hypothetical protein